MRLLPGTNGRASQEAERPPEECGGQALEEGLDSERCARCGCGRFYHGPVKPHDPLGVCGIDSRGATEPETGEGSVSQRKSVREPRQSRTGYRCFLSDLADFTSRPSTAPDAGTLGVRSTDARREFPVAVGLTSYPEEFCGMMR